MPVKCCFFPSLPEPNRARGGVWAGEKGPHWLMNPSTEIKQQGGGQHGRWEEGTAKQTVGQQCHLKPSERWLSHLLTPQGSVAVLFHSQERTSITLWTSVSSPSLPSPHSSHRVHIPGDPQGIFCPFRPSSPQRHTPRLDLTDILEFQNKATRATGTFVKCPQGGVCCQARPSLQQEEVWILVLTVTGLLGQESPHLQLEESPPHCAQTPCQEKRRWSNGSSKSK